MEECYASRASESLSDAGFKSSTPPQKKETNKRHKKSGRIWESIRKRVMHSHVALDQATQGYMCAGLSHFGVNHGV